MVLLSMLTLLGLGIFVISLSRLLNRRTAKRNLWLTLSIMGAVVACVGAGVGLNIARYYSTSNQFVIGLRLDVQAPGDEASVEFALPKGRYALVVHREGAMDEQVIGKIRYDLQVLEQGLALEGEQPVNFGLGISEIRLHYFKVTSRRVKGKLSVEVIEPSGTDYQVKIIQNPFP